MLTKETVEQSAQIKNKDTLTTSNDVVLVSLLSNFLLLTLNRYLFAGILYLLLHVIIL